MKKVLFVALAAVVALASSAFAEVQNVKVGGSIKTLAISENDTDLTSNNIGSGVANVGTNRTIMTVTKLYVAADLTDNVQTYISVLNERDWDGEDNVNQAGTTTGAAGVPINNRNEGLNIDQAYVKLSEFLYSPLTLTIGRQDIFLGSGLVVGDGTPNPQAGTGLSHAYFSESNAFDAVRATLDFDPWTIDLVVAKLDEDEAAPTNGQEEDADLYAINAAYVWPSEWLTEGYYVAVTDNNITAAAAEELHTVGIRAEGPVSAIDEKLYMEAEIAHQWGEFTGTQDVDAWAAILGGSYEFDHEYKPVVGLKYDYRSGEEATGTGDYENWNSPFNGYNVGNLIQKLWLDAYQATVVAADTRGAGGNIHAITASGSFMPLEDVEVALDVVYAMADEEIFAGRSDDIGSEIIGTVTYDYTEDVTLALQGSMFSPDDAFRATEKDDAYEVVGSVSVEF